VFHCPLENDRFLRGVFLQVNKKMKAEGEFYKEKHGLSEYATGSN